MVREITSKTQFSSENGIERLGTWCTTGLANKANKLPVNTKTEKSSQEAFSNALTLNGVNRSNSYINPVTNYDICKNKIHNMHGK